jgi:UTP--glucose-1-phosphate uridylyltransferase
MKITKAVFPVAGMGTRFLPATKASPKEMLPIVDKPLIQYAVEEAVAAGMTEMIFVTGRGKRAIEDHFDRAVELEAELAERGREDLLKIVRDMPRRELLRARRTRWGSATPCCARSRWWGMRPSR